MEDNDQTLDQIPFPSFRIRFCDFADVRAQLILYENSVLFPLWIICRLLGDKARFLATVFSISLKCAFPPSSLSATMIAGVSTDVVGNLNIIQSVAKKRVGVNRSENSARYTYHWMMNQIRWVGKRLE